MRLPITSSAVAARASVPAALGCSCAEIGPCSEGGTGPVPLGCPPGSPWERRYIGDDGLLQSTMSIDWPWRHCGAFLLPGRKAKPVLHSHHILCVLRRPRISPASAGLLTSVTSQT